MQGRDQAGAVADRASLDSLRQVLADHPAGIRLDIEACSQRGLVDVGAVRAGPVQPGPLRVVGPVPAVLVVQRVAQRVERLLPARRRDVQTLACLEVAPRGEHVHVAASVRVAVQHGAPRVAVGLEPGPGDCLELVQRLLDLRLGRLVLRRPGDHAAGVLVLEVQRVGHCRDLLQVAAQDLDLLPPLAVVVQLASQVLGRRGRAARPVSEKLDMHYGFQSASAACPASWPRTRSMAIRCATTKAASAPDL